MAVTPGIAKTSTPDASGAAAIRQATEEQLILSVLLEEGELDG